VAETEELTQLEKKIAVLQRQVNTLSAQLQRVHGLITRPSALMKKYDEFIAAAGLGDLVGTANRVLVVDGAGAIYKIGGVTLNLPQDIHSGASPTFAGLTLTSFNGMLRSVGGVISAGVLPIYADNTAAVAGGLAVGSFYRTNSDPDMVCVVH
jgi:hypothetical protein